MVVNARYRKVNNMKVYLIMVCVSTVEYLKLLKVNYFGHMKRHDLLEKYSLEAKVEGKIRRGRPDRRWGQFIVI